MRCTNRSASWATFPADFRGSKNGSAEPSPAGISGPRRRMTRLSIPNPTIALRQCSTVSIVASPTRRVVRRGRETALVISAGIMTDGLRSIRSNTMPVPGGAGQNSISASTPSKRPLPRTIVGVAMVCCLRSTGINDSAIFVCAMPRIPIEEPKEFGGREVMAEQFLSRIPSPLLCSSWSRRLIASDRESTAIIFEVQEYGAFRF